MKKVVLFVVEGSTDETALQPILKKLLQNDKVKFDVLHRDITSDIKCTTKNIKEKIITKKFLLKYIITIN